VRYVQWFSHNITIHVTYVLCRPLPFSIYTIRILPQLHTNRKFIYIYKYDRRGYSHFKEEALDRTMWGNSFGRGFGPVVRQNTEWMNINKKHNYWQPLKCSRFKMLLLMQWHNKKQLNVTSYCIMYKYLKLCPYLTDITATKQKLCVLQQILYNIFVSLHFHQLSRVQSVVSKH
jgi:hypothetical protein